MSTRILAALALLATCMTVAPGAAARSSPRARSWIHVVAEDGAPKPERILSEPGASLLPLSDD